MSPSVSVPLPPSVSLPSGGGSGEHPPHKNKGLKQTYGEGPLNDVVNEEQAEKENEEEGGERNEQEQETERENEQEHPFVQKDLAQATIADYSITKVDLGPPSRDGEMHNFQVTTTKLVERTKKDKQDKDELKRVVELLSSCLKSLTDPSPQPLDQASYSFNPNYIAGKAMMSKVQKDSHYGRIVQGWVLDVKEKDPLIEKLKGIYDEFVLLRNFVKSEAVNCKQEESL